MSDLIASALEHLKGELGTNRIEHSLSVDFYLMQRAHDSVHEFLSLAPLFFQDSAGAYSWHRKAAFLIYQWECFEIAHRSVLEALCAHYNVAFILLRATLEAILKGALWQCLSQTNYRTECHVLQTEGSQRFRRWLESPLSPVIEENSAALFDEIGEDMKERAFAPGIRTIIRQLYQWGILNPISDPVVLLYNHTFGPLSADVHIAPDTTDIGRRIAADNIDIFERQVQAEPLLKHGTLLHQIMDVAITIELNVLSDFPGGKKIWGRALSKRLHVLESLRLEHSTFRANELIDF